MRAEGLLPPPEPRDRGSGAVRQRPVNEPNRKAFLVYSLALLVMWMIGISLFSQTPVDQFIGLASAWVVATAAAVAFRIRRDGTAWSAAFARRMAPVVGGVVALGVAAWFVLPGLARTSQVVAQGLIPGVLVAVLMVVTGRLLFPLYDGSPGS